MVHGKQIDDTQVNALLKNVVVVIAHNAAFDRPFVEARWPIFETLNWASASKTLTGEKRVSAPRSWNICSPRKAIFMKRTALRQIVAHCLHY
jgi:hypothetical protein